MSDDKIKIGKLGESLAADFLVGKGAEILDKNFYTRWGEIDLVARIDSQILFCEVKTRTSEGFGYPELAVDKFKVSNLLKAIDIYVSAKNVKGFWRLDVLSIQLDTTTRQAKVKWFKNITVI